MKKKKFQTGGEIDPKPKKKTLQKKKIIQDSKTREQNYAALYDPIYNRTKDLFDTNSKSITKVEGAYLTHVEALDEDRIIPPLTKTLKELQGKIVKSSDSEIKKLLKSDSVLEVMKNKPKNIGLLDAYKYYNHIDSLSNEGYTFKNGGVLPDINMKKNKKKKSKLALGNQLEQANPSIGAGIAKGAASGAVTGAAFGPWGAAVGGVVGGTIGGVKANIQKDKYQQAIQAQNNMLLSQSFNGQAGLPTFAKGGQLTPISPDAVEVQANNPNKTDSVELDTAFVDNNEVIDNQNRVFSDDLKAPSGRSIAKEAKRLEKMKNDSSRFSQSNQMIDKKLDDLFGYQERLNKARGTGAVTPGEDKSSRSFTTGGTINPWDLPERQPSYVGDGSYIDDRGNLQKKPLPKLPDPLKLKPVVKQDATFMADSSAAMKAKSYERLQKAGLVKGGYMPKKKLDRGGLFPNGYVDPTEATNSINFGGGGGSDEGGTFDWRKAATTAASFASDGVNAYLTSQLPKVPSPTLERGRKLQRMDPSTALAENSRQALLTSKAIQRGTSQASVQAGNLGSVLAKRLGADNQIRGSYNQLNAQIGNQEQFLNSSIAARNVDRDNMFKSAQIERRNRQLSSYSQVASNVSNKAQLMGREKNMKDLSYAELDVLKKAYEDSGVYNRQLEDILKKLQEKQGYKTGIRFGGRMKKYC